MKNATILAVGTLVLGVGIGVLAAPTPASCKEALSSADSVQSMSAEGFGYAGQALDYAVSWNVAGLDRTTVEMEQLASQVRSETATFNEAANKCDGGER